MEHENNEELEVKAGIFAASFKGHQMFPVILVLLLSAIFAYLFFVSQSKQDVHTAEVVTAIKQMTDSNIKSEGTQRAMMYVLSLSQDQRQALNLMKPRELTDMQR